MDFSYLIYGFIIQHGTVKIARGPNYLIRQLLVVLQIYISFLTLQMGFLGVLMLCSTVFFPLLLMG